MIVCQSKACLWHTEGEGDGSAARCGGGRGGRDFVDLGKSPLTILGSIDFSPSPLQPSRAPWQAEKECSEEKPLSFGARCPQVRVGLGGGVLVLILALHRKTANT